MWPEEGHHSGLGIKHLHFVLHCDMGTLIYIIFYIHTYIQNDFNLSLCPIKNTSLPLSSSKFVKFWTPCTLDLFSIYSVVSINWLESESTPRQLTSDNILLVHSTALTEQDLAGLCLLSSSLLSSSLLLLLLSLSSYLIFVIIILFRTFYT